MAYIDIIVPSFYLEPSKLLQYIKSNGYAENVDKAYEYFLEDPHGVLNEYIESESSYYNGWECSLDYNLKEIKQELTKYINDKSSCS